MHFVLPKVYFASRRKKKKKEGLFRMKCARPSILDLWRPKSIRRSGPTATVIHATEEICSFRMKNYAYCCWLGNWHYFPLISPRDSLLFGALLLLCLIDRQPGSWDSEFDWVVSRSKGASFVSILIELTWDGFLYHVWRAKNELLHSQNIPSGDQVFPLCEICC